MFPERFAPVLAELQPLADRFTAAGHRLFIVGGMVRDLLLNRFSGGDFDLTTGARPDEIKKLLSGWADAVWNQGEKFGTIGARMGDDTVEITTYRADKYDPESRKPHVAFGTDLNEDLFRRDFTVNSMALRLPEKIFVDPFQGLKDLLPASDLVEGLLNNADRPPVKSRDIWPPCQVSRLP